MKIKSGILLLICSLSVLSLQGQDFDYDLAVGARVGMAYGANVKYFLRLHPTRQAHSALEGMITTRYQGMNFGAFYEYHHGIFDTEGLNLYIGGGMHLAVWNSEKVEWDSDLSGYNLYTGFDGIIGMEYVLPYIPLAFSLDWKPGFNIISETNLMIDDIGLSVRYLFK